MKSKRAREAAVSAVEEPPVKKRKSDDKDAKPAKKKDKKKDSKKESRKEKKEKRKDIRDLPEGAEEVSDGAVEGGAVVEGALNGVKEKKEKKEKKDRKDKNDTKNMEEAKTDTTEKKEKTKKDGKEKRNKKKKEEEEEKGEAEEEEIKTKEKKEKKEKKQKKEGKEKKQKKEGKEKEGKEKKQKTDKTKQVAITNSPLNKSSSSPQANGNPSPSHAAAAPNDDDEGRAAEEGKADRHIVFVGNLPYSATQESVWAHFAALKPVSVRCLTRRDNSAECRGVAFVEFAHAASQRACLDRFHHSVFDGRRINVELTAGGGGKTQHRKDKISAKNKKLDENRARRIQREQAAKDGATTSTPEQQAMGDSIHPSRLARNPRLGQ
ncbi:hypothetical protein XA68_12092 [Ophiocordyceps unilateralis]|uniref:RRM domain-containing protein n=1 Tax=Ophiocordyceps unilateralis TaxID=268505 RepID=A0A2A9PDL9_OPHUN|nr:hypothetical protein XA68_12092 [Ophiocordyceps unilateralis]